MKKINAEIIDVSFKKDTERPVHVYFHLIGDYVRHHRSFTLEQAKKYLKVNNQQDLNLLKNKYIFAKLGGISYLQSSTGRDILYYSLYLVDYMEYNKIQLVDYKDNILMEVWAYELDEFYYLIKELFNVSKVVDLGFEITPGNIEHGLNILDISEYSSDLERLKMDRNEKIIQYIVENQHCNRQTIHSKFDISYYDLRILLEYLERVEIIKDCQADIIEVIMDLERYHQFAHELREEEKKHEDKLRLMEDCELTEEEFPESNWPL